MAEEKATTIHRRAAAGRPGAGGIATIQMGPIQQARGPEPGHTARVSRWLAAVAVIVLIIACANAANLMVAAAVRRRHDIAVRLALGAGRARLVRQLFVENSCLVLTAGTAALLIATWTGPLLRAALLPDLPPPDALLDLRVLVASVAITLAAAVLSGLVPAWYGSRLDLVSTLKADGLVAQHRGGVRTALVVIQVALTLTLLAGAGLFMRSLQKVLALDLGVDAGQVLVATMDLEQAGRSTDQINAFYWRTIEHMARNPAVEEVAASVAYPFGMSSGMSVKIPGRDSLPRLGTRGPYYSIVTPGYFKTIGTRIIQGRAFTEVDGAGSPRVVVISETMARVLWPAGGALGKCVVLGDQPQCREVIGVAQDARRFGVVEDPYMHVYVPWGQWGGRAISALFVRPRGDPEALIAPVRKELQSLEPDLPFASVVLLQDLVDPTIRPWRLGTILFGLFGALAMAVAAVGLYSMLSYVVAQRTSEIGVRMALGADASGVLRLVLDEGLRVMLPGLVVGLTGAYAAGRALAALLYGVSPTDLMAFAGVTVVLLAVGTLASYLAARRAAKMEPMVALRHE